MHQFNELTFEELIAKREELQKQYQKARSDAAVAHLENRIILRTLRRQIATLNFLIYNHKEVIVDNSR